MTLFPLVLLATTAGSPVPAQPAPAQPADASVLAEDAVLDVVRAFTAARTASDADALKATLAHDFVEISPRGEIDPRDKVLSFYTIENSGVVPPMRSEIHSVRRSGDMAVVMETIAFDMPGPDGTILERAMRATYVLRRDGAEWRMISAQYTGVVPPRGS